jgi:hypothetical protein
MTMMMMMMMMIMLIWKRDRILKGILEGIRLEVERKFQNENVTYNSVSAFLFLRYFTAAINCPHLYEIALRS